MRVPLRRASIFWILLPERFRMRLLMWWAMREHRKSQRQFWRSHFPLLTPRAVKRVAKILRTEWDHTGVRLLGVPKGDYSEFAKQLIMSIHTPLGTEPRDLPEASLDQALAYGLAQLEAQLGLRDSPLDHRLKVAAHIRASLIVSSPHAG